MPLIDDFLPAPVLRRLRHLSRLERESRAAARGLADELDHWRADEAKHLLHVRSSYKHQEFEIDNTGAVHEVVPTYASVRTGSGSSHQIAGKKLKRRADLDTFMAPLWNARRRVQSIGPEYNEASWRANAFNRALSNAKELLRERYPAIRAPNMQVDL